MNVAEFARQFALKHHGGQKYGDKPYVFHLDAVAQVAKRFGYGTPDVLQACYLHDVVEDTSATIEDVKQFFGDKVAIAVGAVTDPAGANRKEKKAKALPEIRKYPLAVCVKLCDRIANCESGGKNDMYKKEHLEFKKILYRKGEFDFMWAHLDKLLS